MLFESAGSASDGSIRPLMGHLGGASLTSGASVSGPFIAVGILTRNMLGVPLELSVERGAAIASGDRLFLGGEIDVVQESAVLNPPEVGIFVRDRCFERGPPTTSSPAFASMLIRVAANTPRLVPGLYVVVSIRSLRRQIDAYIS